MGKVNDINVLKRELLRVGIEVNDIYELVNSKESYPSAIPVLANLLRERIEPITLREGVIRALAVKEAAGKLGKLLFDEYNKTSNDLMNLKWAIGNTIYETASIDDEDEILRIVANKTNGISRQMFVLLLGKIKSQKSENTLIDLLQDDEVAPHAILALSKLKSERAKEKIIGLLNHPNSLIQKEAAKALKKLV